MNAEQRLRFIFLKAELSARVKLIEEQSFGVPWIKIEYWPPTNGNVQEAFRFTSEASRVEYTKAMCALSGKPFWRDQATQTD